LHTNLYWRLSLQNMNRKVFEEMLLWLSREHCFSFSWDGTTSRKGYSEQWTEDGSWNLGDGFLTSELHLLWLSFFYLLIKSPSITTLLVEVEVTLRLKDSQSVCLGIERPCGTCDQIFLPVGVLLSEICGLISVRRPLWREDGSVICNVITQWFESRRTLNHTLLYHLRFPRSRSRSYFTTVGQSVFLGVGHPFGSPSPVFSFSFLLPENCFVFVLGCPLWLEDGSVICSAMSVVRVAEDS
jgi:hypothetical protein